MPRRALMIGIDARAAVEVPAGRGRVVRELLMELAARDDPHTYRLYARAPWQHPLDTRFTYEIIRAPDPGWNALAARRANRQCDVFLSSNSYLTTWFLTIPAVPIVYDLVTFEPTMRPNRRSRLIERATLGIATRRSAAFVSISQATTDALVHHFPRTRERTTTASLGVSEPPTVTPTQGLPASGFVLAVGTLEPRKNLPRLVAAYRQLPDALQERHPLAVVGALGWETGETLTALRSLGPRCLTLGYVPDADLAELYRRCAVFAYPSLGEGFGLPVLEAMAVGAAVVTSNVSSLPEVGGDAVLYADPRNVDSIAHALQRALTEDTHDLRQRARARARGFTWAHFTAETLRTLESAADGQVRGGSASARS